MQKEEKAMYSKAVVCLDGTPQFHHAAAGFAQPAEGTPTISLSGTDWRIHEDPDGKGAEQRLFETDASTPGWIPATVPGNIQADLEAAHLLKPLWYGAGDPRMAEVARKDWWYCKDFMVPASFAGRRLTLVFDGVDHQCAVWVNGKPAGAHAGMFRRFQFDVSDFVQPGKVNRLAVQIARMPDALAPLLVRTDGSGVGSAFVEGIQATHNSLKDLKSQTNWGWDWGVNIWTLGIWKEVRLEATGPARIDWARVQTSLSDDHAKATVSVALEIDSTADLPALVRFRVTGQNQTATVTVEAALKKGRNIVKGELPLSQPALWWPNGQGGQPLYTLCSELLPADGKTAMDIRTTRFGVREVRWVHTEGAPADFISRYQLIINGRPVRTIGSNLIPPDLLFGRMAPRTLNLFRQAKAAGMNTLRLWGGGVILHEEAYNLADELGIMLSQEMPLACALPPTDPVMLTNLETTVRNIVRQVRNHPAIIEYTGGNEMPWQSGTTHPAFLVMQQVAAEEDDRLMRATCPDPGATHGPWYFNLQTDSIQRVPEVATCPYFDNLAAMRAGEFGAGSPANLEVWHRTMPPKSQWPVSDVNEAIQIRKNIVHAVFEPDYWLRKSFLDQAFGSLDNLSDVVEAGQFYGAEGLRYEIDALRRHGKKTGGLTTWDFNEPWSNGAGSYLVDYDGRTLMSYDYLKQAIAPICLSLRYNSVSYDSSSGVRAELFLTSDAPQAAWNLRWKWLARDRHGRVFAHNEGTASIDPREVKSLGNIELKLPPETTFELVFVEMRLEDSAGALLGERLHVFGPAGVAGPFAGLLKNRRSDSNEDASQKEGRPEIRRPVRRTSLKVKALPMRAEAEREVLELQVQNTGAMTALFCEPHPLIEYRTDLFIDNNHCFIPPGEARTITIKAEDKPRGGLSLAETGWRITTWNADDMVVEPSADVFLAVGRRDQMCREYLGYFDPSKIKDTKQTTLVGTRPDPSQVPYLLDGEHAVRCEFPLSDAQAKHAARLRIHTADQAETTPAKLAITLNGRRMERSLPLGLGIQRSDPAHLAFPATVEFQVPAVDLRPGKNSLEVCVQDDGWFSWDAMDVTSNKENESSNAY